jgi:small subunit ribosomal protein S21
MNHKQLNLTIPGHAIGSKVVKTKRNPKGDIVSALQQWKKSLKDSGALQQLKDKKEFTKKSVIKRRQKQRAIYIESIRESE